MPCRPATIRSLTAALMLAAAVQPALAWSISVNSAPRRVYLHVGNGVRNGDSGIVNRVSVNVPANQLGSGAPLPMTSDSTQSTSLHRRNGGVVCPNPTSQVLIGASYQRNNAGGGTAPMSATLSVSSPPALVNANGDTIPMSEVSWTVSAPGDPGGPNTTPNPGVIPAGAFSGSTQTLATIPANTYIQNCHTFSFANSAVRAAGTYNARVTYTVSSP